jgi:hypothetical protein
VRQLLAESLSLSALGGLLGLALAATSIRVLNATLPPNVLPVRAITIDGMVLAFARPHASPPACCSTRARVVDDARRSARRAEAGIALDHRRQALAAPRARRRRAGPGTMLLIGAGLLGRRFCSCSASRLVSHPIRLLTFQVSPPPSKYPLDSKAPALLHVADRRAARAAGRQWRGRVERPAVRQRNYTQTPMLAPGGGTVTDAPFPIDWRIVSQDFFTVMKIPVIRGRLFTDTDRATRGT